jgi:hypothetical protein
MDSTRAWAGAILWPYCVSVFGGKQVTKHLLDENDVLRLLHEDVNRVGGQSAWARRSGIDRTHLNRVLKGQRPLSLNIAQALKLKKVVAYEPLA